MTVKKKKKNRTKIELPSSNSSGKKKKKKQPSLPKLRSEAGPQEVQNDIKHVILVLFAVLNTITFLFLKIFYILSVHLSLG